MKAKKLISLSLILAMSLAGLTACGGKDNTAGESSASGNTESQGDSAVSASSITILNGKGEVQSQIEKLASTYGSKSGVTVNVKTPGAGVDLQATLKGYYLSDNMPDIITCESASFANWQGLLVDMKDEEWAGRTDSAYVDSDYGTIGFPYTVEAIGLIYNADLLEKAGFISPYTDCKYVSNDPIASAVSEYISSGKTSAWHWLNMKDGLKDATAPVFLDYASGELDASGFATELKKATADYYAK